MHGQCTATNVHRVRAAVLVVCDSPLDIARVHVVHDPGNSVVETVLVHEVVHIPVSTLRSAAVPWHDPISSYPVLSDEVMLCR